MWRKLQKVMLLGRLALQAERAYDSRHIATDRPINRTVDRHISPDDRRAT